MMTYGNARTSLETGDIVLFSGKGGISSGIKWITNSKWSHVGMILKITEFDAVLIWESTTLSSIKDIESGKARQGVQLVPLSERIKNYNGEVSYRKLNFDRTPDMLMQLSILRNEVKERPYEESKIELIKSAYDGPFGDNVEDLSSLFCSELVAEAYQRMGLLGEDIPSNEYTPKDFSDKSNLKLKKGSLSPEEYLKVE